MILWFALSSGSSDNSDSADSPVVVKATRRYYHTKEELQLTNATPRVDVKPCTKDQKLVILITSAARLSPNKAYDLRQMVRQSWAFEANSKSNMRATFFVALHRNDTVNDELKKEAVKYGDMVQFSFIDSYANLTLKNIAGLRWTRRQCPHVKAMMKTDDDVVVNVQLLDSSLSAIESGVTGYTFEHKAPSRDPGNRHYVPEQFHSSNWPIFVGGGAYLVTTDVIDQLLSTIDSYKGYVLDTLDNIFVTGIIAGLAGIERHNDERFAWIRNCRLDAEQQLLCKMCNSIALVDCQSALEYSLFYMRWLRMTCPCTPK